MADVKPVGEVREVQGHATVTHPDGSTEAVTIGTQIYQDDIVETDASGAVNISFIDDSSFAISQDAKLSIDEFVFDPATDSGENNFSLLRGVFVYTSGDVGREDPDDVHIQTPVGSIGIRGTIIAGNINPDGESQISVVEGAIVVKNDSGEQTLSNQYETVTVNGGVIENVGQLDESGMSESYNVLRTVAPDLFVGLPGSDNAVPSDPAGENGATQGGDAAPAAADGEMAPDQQMEQTPMDGQMPQDPMGDSGMLMNQPVGADPMMMGSESGMPGSDSFMMMDFGGMDAFRDMSFDGGDATFSDPFTGTMDGSAGTFDPLAPPPPGDFIFMPPPPPPPPPGSDGTTTTTTGTTAPPPPPPLDVAFIGGDIDKHAAAGFVIGEAFTTVNFTSVAFSLNPLPVNGSGVPLVSINYINPSHVQFLLTAAGASEVLSNGVGFNIGFDVRAQLPDGRVDTAHFNSAVIPNPPLELTSLSGSDGFTISGSGGERLGYAVSAWGGDSDSDGKKEFLISQNQSSSGVFGYDDSRTSTAVSTSLLYPSLAGLGDTNGDGVKDYVYGTPVATSNSGDVEIAGSTSSISLINSAVGDKLGTSVAGIGDINGDGLNDTLIGSPGWDANDYGKAYVVFGGAASMIDVSGTILSSDGFAVLGVATDERIGTNVSGAGDFNKDGYADYMMSSFLDTVSPNYGTVYITFGANGITGSANGPNTMELTGIEFDNTKPDIPMGHIGDFNGDGISDIFVASTYKNTDADATREGEIYVVYGNPGNAIATSIDVNSMSVGQGFKITLTDPAPEAEFAGGGAAGDFNGDGFADFAVVTRTGGKADIYVVYGNNVMGDSIDNSYFENDTKAFHMTYDLSAVGLVNPATDLYDFRIASIGDHNGDGFDDIAIGTPEANGNNGEVIVVYGRNEAARTSMGDSVHIATTELPDVVASANNQALVGNSGNNILTQNGMTGISFSGGAGADIFEINNGSFRSIDGGSGGATAADRIDTLKFLPASGSLNFSILGSEKISGIEHIEMNASGQTVTLGIDDIFKLMQESDLMIGGRHILKISDASGGATTFSIEDNGKGTNFSALGFSGETTADSDSDGWRELNFGTGYQLLIQTTVDTISVV